MKSEGPAHTCHHFTRTQGEFTEVISQEDEERTLLLKLKLVQTRIKKYFQIFSLQGTFFLKIYFILLSYSRTFQNLYFSFNFIIGVEPFFFFFFS